MFWEIEYYYYCTVGRLIFEELNVLTVKLLYIKRLFLCLNQNKLCLLLTRNIQYQTFQ